MIFFSLKEQIETIFRKLEALIRKDAQQQVELSRHNRLWA